MNHLEYYDTPLAQCELKFRAGESRVFEGYASAFNSNDSDGDTILPGAFGDTIKQRTPAMFLEHERHLTIGKWLSLSENKTGLKVKGELTPGHSVADNAYASIKHGAITGLSIGFRIPPGGAAPKNEDDPFFGGRVINKVDLFEISVVSMPAEDRARITGAKAEIETIQSLKDAELYLRDAGRFSRSTATAFVSQLKAMCRRDADAENAERIAELTRRLAYQARAGEVLARLKQLSIEGIAK